MAGQLAQHAGWLDEGQRQPILAMLDYRRADVSNAAEVADVIRTLHEPAGIYLALPPSLFSPVTEALAAVTLPADTRFVVELPFGEDLESAQELLILDS